jgi:hypothetical protein
VANPGLGHISVDLYRERLDGLCPGCFRPSLWRVTGTRLDSLGVSTIYARVMCVDGCKITPTN